MYLEIYELDPVFFFFTAPGFSMASSLKKTKAQLDLATDIDMPSMVEKDIR